jgi:hypothetical protein
MVSAEDQAAIFELMARYNWMIDTGDVDQFASLFTEDGMFDGILGRYKGSEQLQILGNDFRERALGRGMQHWTCNTIFEQTEDTITVRSQVFGPRRAENKTHSVGYVGYYVDECRKVDGKWLLKSRRFRPWEGTVLNGFRE